MTIKSKLCKYFDYENKGHIIFSDFSIIFLYVIFGIGDCPICKCHKDVLIKIKKGKISEEYEFDNRKF